MLLSILIPTLKAHESSFRLIHGQLVRQISRHGLGNEVEILCLQDSGEESVSSKRNRLLGRASGLFVAFAEDDDEVSEDYVRKICEAIRSRPDLDCIGISGMVRFRGRYPRRFVHSVRYGEAFLRNCVYYRPPCHRNPTRRDIALRYEFRNVPYPGSGADRAQRMLRDGALHQEILIESVLYHQQANRWWLWQWLLDVTRGLKRTLGGMPGRFSFEKQM